MKRNALKIVFDLHTKQLSYFFRNEMGEWFVLDGSSPLSCQLYIDIEIKENGKAIVEKIDEIYNRKNKGLDIFFEGPLKIYEYLTSLVETYLSKRNIKCQLNVTRIAVVGKKGSGKTFLINGLCDLHGYKYEHQIYEDYEIYIDKNNHIEWFEIHGIDLGTSNLARAFSTLESLVIKKGISKVLYCIRSESGRIENSEIEFLRRVDNAFSQVTVLPVLTLCYQENKNIQQIIDEIKKKINHTEVLPVLSKEYKTGKDRRGNFYIVEAFGLEELYSYIFKGIKLPRARRKIREENEFSRKKESKQFSNQSIGSIPSTNKGLSSDKNIKADNIEYERESSAFQKEDRSFPKSNRQEENNISYVDDNNSDRKADVQIQETESTFDYKKVAVIGKRAVGKSFLIESLGHYRDLQFNVKEQSEYTLYEDREKKIHIYEITGIDLGRSNVFKAFDTIRDLISKGVSFVLYCVSADVGRLEKIEKDHIMQLKNKFPKVKVTVVLTKSYRENLDAVIREVTKNTNRLEVIPTLAKEYKTGMKNSKTGLPLIVEPFGVSELYSYIFEEGDLPELHKNFKKKGMNEQEKIHRMIANEKREDVKAINDFSKASNDKIEVKHNEINENLHFPEIGMRQSLLSQNENKLTSEDVVSINSEVKVPDKQTLDLTKEKKILIFGKKATGKTTLIDSLEKYKGTTFERYSESNYILYKDVDHCIELYELEGIDFGEDIIEKFFLKLRAFIKKGISDVFYCISADMARLEEIEKKILKQLSKEFLGLKINVVLTKCYKEEIEGLVNEIKKIDNRIEIIETLAKEYQTGIRVPRTGLVVIIEPFGIDKVSQYIYGG